MLTEAEAARVADDLTRCHTLDTLLSMMGRRSMSQRVLYEAMEAVYVGVHEEFKLLGIGE